MKELVLLTSLIIAGEWDACFYKVPNKLVIAALITGFGISPSIQFIVRFMAVILIGAGANKIGLIGAGDVKLYALICAFTGVMPFLKTFALSVLLAGGMAIVKILINRKLIVRVPAFLKEMIHAAGTKKLTEYKSDKASQLPMAAAIAAGYILYLI